MFKRILALSLLMVGLAACGGQEDPAGELTMTGREQLINCDGTPCSDAPYYGCLPNNCINNASGIRACWCIFE